MKEMTCAASFLGQYTEQLLLQLAAMTGQLALKAARARYAQEPTGTTAPSAQPSCCVWHKGALLFKGEDKVPLYSNMAEAVRELGSNMARTWNGMAMGSLPFIVCYASCGSKLQYHIIKQDTSTALEVSEEFDLNRVRLERCRQRCGLQLQGRLLLRSGLTHDLAPHFHAAALRSPPTASWRCTRA